MRPSRNECGGRRTIATKPAMTTIRNFWTAGASHSLQNARKISFYKSMGEFKLAAPRTDEVEGSSWARQAAIQCSPCRVVRAKSAPPATNVAHPPKTKEARANHCSPEPLQLGLRIGSATSHQKETAKARPNTTATAIPVDLSNAIPASLYYQSGPVAD